jgi:transposase
MSEARKETTIEERNLAIREFSKGRSYKDIGDILKRPTATVKAIIRRYGLNGYTSNKRRTGRPRSLTERQVRFIVRSAEENPRSNAEIIKEELATRYGSSVSGQTIRNRLKEEGLSSRMARNKPFISENNKQKRLEFAKNHLDKPIDFWRSVLFTDESKFNIHESDGKVRVWRRVNEALKTKNLKGTVKHGGGGVMVWGCMSARGLGKMVFIDGIMDHRAYIKILTENLQPSVQMLGLPDSFVFQQDNDPKHTALNTRLWLLFNTRKQLNTPPQSPDLNPIEHIWSEVERRLRRRRYKNREELKTALVEIWGTISEEVTSKLIDSMKRRLEAVIAAKGGPTKY